MPAPSNRIVLKVELYGHTKVKLTLVYLDKRFLSVENGSKFDEAFKIIFDTLNDMSKEILNITIGKIIWLWIYISITYIDLRRKF